MSSPVPTDKCSRLRTDLAVMYACGINPVEVDGSQAHFCCPQCSPTFAVAWMGH